MNKNITAGVAATLLPLFLMVSFLLWHPAAMAQEVKIIQPIKPAPQLAPKHDEVILMHRLALDGRGRVDRMDSKEIVIDDTLKKLAPGATYISARGVYLSRRGIRPGDWVGYRLDSDGRITHLLRLNSTRN